MYTPAVMLVVLQLLLTPPSAAASELPHSPSANAVYQFQKSNRTKPWLHIVTDSGSVTRRAKLVDRSGLYNLTAPDGTKEPGPLLWRDIRRVDEVVTRSRQMHVVGGIVLGLTFAGLGNALGAPDGKGHGYALAGMLIGQTVGGVLGSRYGERYKSERLWYADPHGAVSIRSDSVATNSLPPAPIISTPAVPLEAVASGSLESAPPLAPSAQKACDRINSNLRIRVHSRLGMFDGYAASAGPQGLGDLRPFHRPRRGAAAPPLPDLIAWDDIDRVEARGGSSLNGALAGAMGFAAFGALVGAAAIAASSSDYSVAGAAGIGALYLAPVGLVLGGLSGMAVRHWVAIYKRP